jgi:hypothetical protein
MEILVYLFHGHLVFLVIFVHWMAILVCFIAIWYILGILLLNIYDHFGIFSTFGYISWQFGIFRAFWFILWPFGLFYGHLVYFMAI